MNKNKRNVKIATSLNEVVARGKLSGNTFSVKVISRGADGKKGTDDDKIRRKSKTKVKGDSMGEGKIDEVNLAKVTDDSLKKRMKQLRTGGKTEMPSVQFMIKKISKEMKKRGLKEVKVAEDKKWHWYNLDRGVYKMQKDNLGTVSYTHLRAHETREDLV